jgi:hypothetical protein
MINIIRRKTMCAIDDAEPCPWFGTKIRFARKQHQCSECDRAIAPSESYAYSTYAFNGSAYSHKACAHCNIAKGWLEKHCGGGITGGLREELEEHYEQNYRCDRLGRLLTGVKRQWQRFDGAGLMRSPAEIQ